MKKRKEANKMNKKLRLIKRDRLDYGILLPERFKYLRCTRITIKFIDGEYQYIPRNYTFANNTRLAADELLMIVEELKRLNQGSNKEQ